MNTTAPTNTRIAIARNPWVSGIQNGFSGFTSVPPFSSFSARHETANHQNAGMRVNWPDDRLADPIRPFNYGGVQHIHPRAAQHDLIVAALNTPRRLYLAVGIIAAPRARLVMQTFEPCLVRRVRITAIVAGNRRRGQHGDDGQRANHAAACGLSGAGWGSAAAKWMLLSMAIIAASSGMQPSCTSTTSLR